MGKIGHRLAHTLKTTENADMAAGTFHRSTKKAHKGKFFEKNFVKNAHWRSYYDKLPSAGDTLRNFKG